VQNIRPKNVKNFAEARTIQLGLDCSLAGNTSKLVQSNSD